MVGVVLSVARADPLLVSLSDESDEELEVLRMTVGNSRFDEFPFEA